MNILKRLGNIFVRNLWLKVLAIFLATVVWVVVARINDPVSSNTFNNVKVTLLNADTLINEGKVFQVLDKSDQVRVTVRAPQSVMNSISVSDITVYADLSEISEEGKVPIVCNLDRAESIVLDHNELLVNVEDKKTRYINISYEIVGAVGEGCVQGKVNLDRNRIEISGPASDVDKVSYAKVIIDLDGALKTISADMEIGLYDSDNRRIESENIIKQTDYVTATVTVLSTKEVPVIATVTGEVSPDCLFTDDIFIDPEVVTIAGDTGVLNTITAIQITDPVDINGATSDVVATYDLSNYIPTGVSIADDDYNGEVDVVAYIEKIAEKTISVPLSRITILNIPDGYKAGIIADDTVSVRLTGLRAELNAISADSITGTAELDENMTPKDGEIVVIPVHFNMSAHTSFDPIEVHIIISKD